MSEMLDIFKKNLYNFTQKAKKRTNAIIGTEMEIGPEIEIEQIQNSDEKEKIIKYAEEIKQQIITAEEEENIPKISKYDKEISPYYIGCYSDDPTNLSMSEYLGTVSNPVDCMKLGKDKGYEYVGIQQGDKCYASKELPNTVKVEEKYCGIQCNQPNTGTCGGYFYNKVYNTNGINTLNEIETKEISIPKIIENYNNTNESINNINRNIGNLNYADKNSSIYPINQYILAITLVIILIILYLIVDKLN
jgi:hypothetical protein